VEGITEDAIKAIEGAWIFCHTFSPMIKPWGQLLNLCIC
jgi:hypothetical protein